MEVIMSTSSVPNEIKKFRPGPSTIVKFINGHYYVYMYEAAKLASGRWGTKTGKCIGSIIPEEGFLPNKNYDLYKQSRQKYQLPSSKIENDVLEYGQYKLVETITKEIYESLKRFFPLNRAAQIYNYCIILLINEFLHKDQISRAYKQCWLAYEYRNFTFKLGKDAISSLLDDLGRKTSSIINYENDAISRAEIVAIDGHAIRSCSDENDLGEAGYKFNVLKEDQVNLLMGYDIKTEMPLFARMFRGSCNDKSTVNEIMNLLSFSGILFVIDRGFYSEKNLELFSENGNSYIIPLSSNLNNYKSATEDIHYVDDFYYRSGRRYARIQYTFQKISESECVYVFRDVDENEKCRYNYMRNIERNRKGYTRENFEIYKETFGVYVLQSNAPLTPEEIYSMFKKRWGIETFYQYIKNDVNFNNLKLQSYYEEQGFSFIMLVTGQIHQMMLAAVKGLNDTTMSVSDLLYIASNIKMVRIKGKWYCKNTNKKELEILKRLGFVPEMIVQDE